MVNCSLHCRMLVAYEKGLLVLWDVDKSETVSSGGYSALKVRVADGTDSLTGTGDYVESMVANHEEENEICSLCWVSANNSIAAVGYINGDVLLWDFTSNSSTKRQQPGNLSNNVVKLQLASAERRLPVIVLHWSANSKGSNETGGQLFIYGGDEIGSEEVLAVFPFTLSEFFEFLTLLYYITKNLYHPPIHDMFKVLINFLSSKVMFFLETGIYTISLLTFLILEK